LAAETELTEEEPQKEIARLTEKLKRTVQANLTSRAIHKWLLEFVRNGLVVATLFFLARRSGDWWIYGIAFVAAFSLLAYSYSYAQEFWYKLEFKSQGWRRKLAVGIGAGLLELILPAMTVGMYITIDRIVTIQMQAMR
jgi:hypothetical protein